MSEGPAKSPQAFRTISEVADALGVQQHVLRFWETKFSAIKPLKRGGNRRYYRPEDVALLRAINRLLYTEGYTIRGVQKLIDERGANHLAKVYSGAQPDAGQDQAASADAAAIGPSRKPAPVQAKGGLTSGQRSELTAIRNMLSNELARGA